jgi:hypothetical protein
MNIIYIIFGSLGVFILLKYYIHSEKKIDDRNKQIDKIKNQRQKESDEYWESFISKYPLLGISNWLFGEQNIGKFINK